MAVDRAIQWVPSDRTCSRICGILYKAHNKGFIDMQFKHVDVCRQGCLRSTKHPLFLRSMFGRIWRIYGNRDLAEQVGYLDRLTEEVKTELESQMTA